MSQPPTRSFYMSFKNCESHDYQTIIFLIIGLYVERVSLRFYIMVNNCKVLIIDYFIKELKVEAQYTQIIPVGEGFLGPANGTKTVGPCSMGPTRDWTIMSWGLVMISCVLALKGKPPTHCRIQITTPPSSIHFMHLRLWLQIRIWYGAFFHHFQFYIRIYRILYWFDVVMQQGTIMSRHMKPPRLFW